MAVVAKVITLIITKENIITIMRGIVVKSSADAVREKITIIIMKDIITTMIGVGTIIMKDITIITRRGIAVKSSVDVTKVIMVGIITMIGDGTTMKVPVMAATKVGNHLGQSGMSMKAAVEDVKSAIAA